MSVTLYDHDNLPIKPTQAAQPYSSELHEKALIHRALAQGKEAVSAYQAALGEEPRQVTWRFELAQLLHEQGQFEDARRQLFLVLGQQPRHPGATRLLESVARHQAAGQSN